MNDVEPINPVIALDEENQRLAAQCDALGKPFTQDEAALIKVDALARLLLHGPFGHIYELTVAQAFNEALKAKVETKLVVPGITST